MIKLQLQDVSIQYFLEREQKFVQAIKQINFEVEKGQFVSIIGPSGCGKTTLLQAIAGLIAVAEGKILIDGKEAKKPSSNRAMVFQSPSLIPWRTIIRNVSYGLELQGCPKKQAQHRAQQYINLVGLQGFEKNFPHELSGGMQQRVNLARALAIEPSLLLLDEPLSALDAQSREYMQWELQQIWQQVQNTVIYVTHQIDEAIFLSDQVIIMSAHLGKIKEVVAIDFPRPRSLAIKRESKFIDLENYIWQNLEKIMS